MSNHHVPSSSPARLKVLLVEDDANDVELLKLAFRAGATPHLEVAFNGREAAEALRARPEAAGAPDLILCDLNMPIMNGFEFLKWLKQESPFPRTPLVVLTSSVVETDVARAYDLGAAAYLVKPSSHQDLQSLAKKMVEFWSMVNIPATRRDESAA